MDKIFSNGIDVNDGTPYNPALRFLTNRTTGIYLDNDKSLGISVTGVPNTIFHEDCIEMRQNLRISKNAVDKAILTSDSNGNAAWIVKSICKEFKWNSIYKWLDPNTLNNENVISFDNAMNKLPVITLTKESDFPISNVELYVKNKSVNGFTIYSDTFMSKLVLEGDIANYTICHLSTGVGICYYNVVSDRMEYIYSNDEYSVFSSPIVIDDISAIGICSITMVNNHPAILYMADNGINDVWRYIRSNDVFGISWGTPVEILTSTVDLTFLSNSLFLYVIDDKPVIFTNDESGCIQIIHSTDSLGVVWNTPIIVSNLLNHQLLDIKINTNGISLIAKSNDTNELFYVKSNNVNGTQWVAHATKLYKQSEFGNIPILVNIGNGSSVLGVINDKLCIIASELDTNNLYILRATDIIGSSWNICEYITTPNTTNSFPTLFKNNETMYLIYNSYIGNPSEKCLIEFKKNNELSITYGFISSLKFCTNHHVLPNKKSTYINNGNIILMLSDQKLILLKFYGNDFVINWSAMI